MIQRYTTPEMGRIWTDETKFRTWWEVEREVCRYQAEKGLIPPEDMENIERKASFDIDRILEIEAEVQHDVIAFLTNLSENIGPSARFIHLGMTSSDLLDTAFALQVKQAGEVLKRRLDVLLETLKNKAQEFAYYLMIGRTHGIHAEPITFGLKIAIWWEEFKRHAERLDNALRDVCVGKISGAVGTYQHLSPDVETEVCKRLGIKSAPVSNQIVQRDRHAFFIAVITGIGASLEKISTEIRHLQRTEVLEVLEPFGEKQKGSSAMPHKKNPIICERISGMSRLLRGYCITALENVNLWHERDISHSSTERVIFPDATILLDYMLVKTINVLRNMSVNRERMLENLNSTGGLIYSQEVLLALVKKGMTREKAYEIVQSLAMRTWEEKGDFKQLLKENQEVLGCITEAELEKLFNPDKILSNVKIIFNRIGLKPEKQVF